MISYMWHFWIWKKAYDRVNRKKLFEIMRDFGVHEKLVSLIERVYQENMVKFELGEVMTGWCRSDSGVRQGCPLSPLLFNLYVRELGQRIADCNHGFQYKVVDENGSMTVKIQSGFLYADDICLVASCENDLQSVLDCITPCIEEYGLKVSERKSKVLCINEESKDRSCCIRMSVMP